MRVTTLLLCALVVCAPSVSAPLLAQEARPPAELAKEAYDRKDFLRSAELYREAIRQGEPRPTLLYNAAAAYARAGKKEEAFQHLRQAVAFGFSAAEPMRKDPDLESLRNDPRWPSVVEQAAAREKSQAALWKNPALDTPYRENLSEDEKAAGLSKLWAEAKFNFVNFHLVPELDWDALYLSYLPRVRQTKTTAEYYRLLQEMAAQLKDGHTSVNVPAELRDQFYSFPQFATRLVEGKVLIALVRDEGLTKAGLARGQELVEIDGQSVREYAEQRVAPYVFASTPQDRLMRTYEQLLLTGPAGKPLELTLRDAEGRVLKVTAPRLGSEERAKLAAAAGAAQQQPTLVSLRMLPGNVAHVAVNTFNDPKVGAQFEELFPQFAGAAALVIDIRANGGGDSGNAYKVLSMLTDKPFKGSQWYTRDYRPAFRAWGRQEETYGALARDRAPHGSKHYAGPVFVLTSVRTFSAAEDFLVAFGNMRRGLVVGEPTGGSTGQPLMMRLPGGGYLSICSKHDAYADGREFIGVGVRPDKVVYPTLADFRAGRDTILEAALEEIRKTGQTRNR